MPYMIPTAVCMAPELATYGAVAGILYYLLRGKKFATYISLIGAMMAGRIVWGVASIMVYGMMGNPFTWGIFAAGAVVNAIPGIILQLVVIPPIITVLRKSGFMENRNTVSKVETV